MGEGRLRPPPPPILLLIVGSDNNKTWPEGSPSQDLLKNISFAVGLVAWKYSERYVFLDPDHCNAFRLLFAQMSLATREKVRRDWPIRLFHLFFRRIDQMSMFSRSVKFTQTRTRRKREKGRIEYLHVSPFICKGTLPLF